MTRPVDDSFAQGLVGVTLDGRYRLDAVLGEGGMGSVFRATQLAMERKVAVKLLKPHLTSEPAALERFAREARATLKVDSPHAVKILDFGVTPVGDYYMVLEYLDGRTVQRELEIDGPFAPARVAHIARQALHALGAAHAQGLIHRDVKPDNLLLMRAGADGDYTKVLDFGVAKLMQGAAGDPGQLALTAAGMVFGTPEFMSPEQACGQPLDGRSDLYSLAATMFVMLTGTGLFEAVTAIEWLTHHARTPAPLLAIVRPELAAYPELDAHLQRCLAKHREQRPATAAEMARLLAELEPALVRRADAAPTPLASKPTPSRPSAYVPVLRDTAANSTAAIAVSGPAPAALAAPGMLAPAAIAAPIGTHPPAHAAGHVASARHAASVDTNPPAHARHAAALATALAVAPSSGSAITLEAPAAPQRRRLALWLGGIAIASVVGIAAGLSLHRPGDRSTAGGNGAAASAAPDRAAASAAPDRASSSALPVDAGAGPAPADARVAVAALPVADAPPDAGVAVAPTTTPPPTPPPRPLPAAAPRNPAAEEHLRAAEDALQTNHPLRQLAEADLALRASPRSARARYLLGDALIKLGDLDRGCSYLAQLKHLTSARSRARAAGCPSD